MVKEHFIKKFILTLDVLKFMAVTLLSYVWMKFNINRFCHLQLVETGMFTETLRSSRPGEIMRVA